MKKLHRTLCRVIGQGDTEGTIKICIPAWTPEKGENVIDLYTWILPEQIKKNLKSGYRFSAAFNYAKKQEDYVIQEFETM